MVEFDEHDATPSRRPLPPNGNSLTGVSRCSIFALGVFQVHDRDVGDSSSSARPPNDDVLEQTKRHAHVFAPRTCSSRTGRALTRRMIDETHVERIFLSFYGLKSHDDPHDVLGARVMSGWPTRLKAAFSSVR